MMIQIDKPMPDGCDVCPLMYDYIQCNALPEGCKDDDAFNEEGFDWTKRPKWCPLKEQEEIINDLKKIIPLLNQHIKDLSEYMTPYGMVKDVKAYVELRKEQNAVVRCKDCKHWEQSNGHCPFNSIFTNADWFCADGERRENE